MLKKDIEKELEGLRSAALIREISDRTPAGSPGDMPSDMRVTLRGRTCINFASNDYLGLASEPALYKEAAMASEKFGSGAGASRLLAGGTELHSGLEKETASLKGAPSALLFGTGYAANTGAIPALAREGDTLFSDELNHASIIDGCRLSRAEVIIYRHRDTAHLEELMKGRARGRNIIVTDTVFSMEGDIAPIEELDRLAQAHGALLYLDDAHGTGVLGPGGEGALAHLQVASGAHIVQMGTFSKALGSMGGFVAGEEAMVQYLVNRARTFVFSTALPAPVVAASLAALEAVRTDQGRRERLRRNCALMADALTSLGIDGHSPETPIFPIKAGDTGHALSISSGLFKQAFHAPAIRPPSVPHPIIRASVSAAHRPEDIRAFADAISGLL